MARIEKRHWTEARNRARSHVRNTALRGKGHGQKPGN
jgi:hypothetical protein